MQNDTWDTDKPMDSSFTRVASGDGAPASSAAATGATQGQTEAVVRELLSLIARERAAHLQRWCRQDLSLAHLHVLQALEAGGSLPMSRLAGILDVSLSNATGIVTRMEDRELVRREHDEADRRVVFVTLTDRGREVVEDRQFLHAQHLHRVLEAMPEGERMSLVRSLRCFMTTVERLRQEGLLPEEGDVETCGPAARPSTSRT